MTHPLFRKEMFVDYVDKPSTPTVMPQWFIEAQNVSSDV
jgi:hypothetical protein